jgi:O-antigen/teichoic acid export membrane protein
VVAAGVLARGAAAFALTKSCAALLGPVEFARYGHFLMVATYLLTASTGGLGNAFTVYLGRRAPQPGADAARDGAAVALAGAATGAVAALVLALLLAAGVTGSFLPHIDPVELPAWIAFCVAAGLGGAFLAALLAAQRHLAYQALAASMPILSLACLGLLHYAWGLNADRAILSYMAGYGLPALVFLIGGPSLRTVTRGALSSVARFALPYLLPSLLVPTVGSLSILAIRRVVASHTTPVDLGLWQALWRVAESYMGVLIAIVSALYIPRLARAQNRADASRLVVRTCAFAAALYAPIGVALLVAPRLAVHVLLARSFLGIEPLLPMQVVGDLLKVVATVLILTCTGLLRPGLTLAAEVVLNTGAGAAGAVTAYAAAYAVLLVFLGWGVRILLRRMPTGHGNDASAEAHPPLACRTDEQARATPRIPSSG